MVQRSVCHARARETEETGVRSGGRSSGSGSDEWPGHNRARDDHANGNGGEGASREAVMLVYEFPLCSSVPSVVIVSLIDNREHKGRRALPHIAILYPAA